MATLRDFLEGKLKFRENKTVIFLVVHQDYKRLLSILQEMQNFKQAWDLFHLDALNDSFEPVRPMVPE